MEEHESRAQEREAIRCASSLSCDLMIADRSMCSFSIRNVETSCTTVEEGILVVRIGCNTTFCYLFMDHLSALIYFRLFVGFRQAEFQPVRGCRSVSTELRCYDALDCIAR